MITTLEERNKVVNYVVNIIKENPGIDSNDILKHLNNLGYYSDDFGYNYNIFVSILDEVRQMKNINLEDRKYFFME